ncbi:MAG TPA: nucleotidyltransferase domain-containing protein [Bradyrhizobium sp.]|nr:nucleotidyltransferase domain-containing protein [Bradyrhizobium sp.]
MRRSVAIFWAMRRDDVIARLKQTEPALRAFGVDALYLFGSHARDEAGPDSDIDVFIDPVPDKGFGFAPFMDAYETLQEAVGEKLDYGTRKGLHPLLRADIEREALRVF